jgi:hypothetical protein
MKKESRDRIIKAYEDVSALLGFDNLGSGLSYMYREMETTLRMLKPLRTREALESFLTREPEPGPDQLDAMTKSIALFPYVMRKNLPAAVKEAQKRLPHDPGGRPEVVEPEDYPKVCDEIGQLYARGTPLKTAQQRVAQRRDVSLRTIQRIWQKRAESTASS